MSENIMENEALNTPAAGTTEGPKKCYFWRLYKYFVDVDQISLLGWVEWCNELYAIQHRKPRPEKNKIFIPSDLKTAMVKARCWNKDEVEKWLNDHGYRWTRVVETRYQFPFDKREDVELIDSDEQFLKEHPAN